MDEKTFKYITSKVIEMELEQENKETWTPTPELRYKQVGAFIEGSIIISGGGYTLQQRWVREDRMLRKYFEWRDVPLED